MCQSSRRKLQSCDVFISCVNHQGGSYKVAMCLYHASIIMEEVLKLRCEYIMRKSSRRVYKVAMCLYHASIIMEEVIVLRFLYIMC